jgi:polyphosphate glucokinase
MVSRISCAPSSAILADTGFIFMLSLRNVNGKEAEKWAAASVRDQKQLSWKKWADRLDVYLTHMQRYLWPDLVIVGGGVSKKHDKFLPRLTLETKVVPAQMRNEAGIVGAALVARQGQKPEGEA